MNHLHCESCDAPYTKKNFALSLARRIKRIVTDIKSNRFQELKASKNNDGLFFHKIISGIESKEAVAKMLLLPSLEFITPIIYFFQPAYQSHKKHLK